MGMVSTMVTATAMIVTMSITMTMVTSCSHHHPHRKPGTSPQLPSRHLSNLSSANTPYPFDDLTQQEIDETVIIIKDSQKFPSNIRFALIANKVPDKKSFLKWEQDHGHGSTFNRQALAVLFDKNEKKLWEVVVDLDQQKMLSSQHIKDHWPPIMFEEYDKAEEIVRQDLRWQEAMNKRGIINFQEVYTDVWAPGMLSEDEKKLNHRLLRVVSFYRGKGDNTYGRPIEGVLSTIDMTTGKVLKIVDQEIFPLPTTPAELDEKNNLPLRKGIKPLTVVQTEGPSFQVHGQKVEWQNWSFRYSMHPMKGLTLYQVRYRDHDRNNEERSILYQANIAEMVVPYGDADRNWSFRNAFDVGEYGLGFTAHPMVEGADFPENAQTFDVVLPDTNGVPFTIPKAVALYERDGGLIWKHYDSTTEKTQTRRGRQLVITFMTTIGNYDYGIDWIFHQDGTISVEARLTGILLAKGTTQSKNLCDPGCLQMAEPYILSPNHQHYFSFRFDFDIDGTQNTPYIIDTAAIPLGEKNPAGNAFGIKRIPVMNEKNAFSDLSLEKARMWKIINKDKRNSLGHPVGYALMPGENAVPYLHPTSPVRKKAAFINHHVWFTRYHQSEQSPAGEYPNQRDPNIREGINQWMDDNESLQQEDVVLWYTLGVTHIPRPEEWPIMSVYRTGFHLVPMNYFTQNPAMDLPAPPSLKK